MPRPTARPVLLSLLLVSSAVLAAPGCMVEDDGSVDQPPAEAPREDDVGEVFEDTGVDDEPGAVEVDLDVTLAARRADAPDPTTGELGRGRSPYSPDVIAPDDPQPGDADDEPDAIPPGPGPGPGLGRPRTVAAPR